MEQKKFWQSKTMLFGFITAAMGALGYFVPGAKLVNDYIVSHGAELTMLWGMVAMGLRMVTKDKIQLGE